MSITQSAYYCNHDDLVSCATDIATPSIYTPSPLSGYSGLTTEHWQWCGSPDATSGDLFFAPDAELLIGEVSSTPVPYADPLALGTTSQSVDAFRTFENDVLWDYLPPVVWSSEPLVPSAVDVSQVPCYDAGISYMSPSGSSTGTTISTSSPSSSWEDSFASSPSSDAASSSVPLPGLSRGPSTARSSRKDRFGTSRLLTWYFVLRTPTKEGLARR